MFLVFEKFSYLRHQQDRELRLIEIIKSIFLRGKKIFSKHELQFYRKENENELEYECMNHNSKNT